MSFKKARVRPSGSVAELCDAKGRAYSSASLLLSGSLAWSLAALAALPCSVEGPAPSAGLAGEISPWIRSQPGRPARREQRARAMRDVRTPHRTALGEG